MSETATRLPRIRADKKPEWSTVIDRFYGNSFDATNGAALLDSAEAWASMDPDEQSFHMAHLAFRQVQALGDVHASLNDIKRGLATLDPKSLAALKHLPGVKRALVVIARGQQEMLEVLEANGSPNGVSGETDDDDDDGDSDGDDDDTDGDDDDSSELADAVESDDIDEEEHGFGESEALLPEVILLSPRRSAPTEGGAS